MTAAAGRRPPDLQIRPCEAGDLRALEWEGRFTAHREIIADAFERQRTGRNIMLLAEAGGRIAGQVWVDLDKGPARGGLLWALRVHPSMRGRGIGSALLDAAEAWLARHGFESAALGVEKSNPAALRLYRRRGYRLVRPLVERYGFTPPGGTYREVTVDQWLLEKPVDGTEARP